jgi:hypothetical protein
VKAFVHVEVELSVTRALHATQTVIGEVASVLASYTSVLKGEGQVDGTRGVGFIGAFYRYNFEDVVDLFAAGLPL